MKFIYGLYFNLFRYKIYKINVWGLPSAQALRSNLFVRTSQKGFPLQSLSQKKIKVNRKK